MEVNLSCEWVRSATPNSSQGDARHAEEDSFNMRTAETACVEVTRQELH